jgi:hypothetical protein
VTTPAISIPNHDDNTMELGPDLPMSVFTSTEPWNAERIGALALYCSDGRWGAAFDEFCHKQLQIPRYDRWAVPGGPAWLAERAGNASFVATARTQVDFLVKVHELERIVLITHFGCAEYGNRLQKPPLECVPTQLEDLNTAAAVLRDWYPGMRVESYLAMRRGRALSFHELNPGLKSPA